MFHLTVRTARVGVIASGLIAATISVAAPTIAHAATAKPQTLMLAKASILRCDMADGAVIFADMPCKGAAKVKKWAPVKVPRGITASPAAVNTKIAHPADGLTLRNADPYVDCKERGGHFRVTARLCVIPSKTFTKIQRIR